MKISNLMYRNLNVSLFILLQAQIQKSVKTAMDGSFRNFEKVSQGWPNLIISSLFFTLLFSTVAFSENKSDIYIEVKEKNKVCMVNNFYNPMADFSKFKVTLDKKDYYGCCAMCKGTLTSQKEIREAVDPFSKKKVDKAEAFIVADKNDNGKTLYFENKENFEKFLAK